MWTQLYIDLRTFFEAGGIVLWPILGLTIVLWTLLLERFWYVFLAYPRYQNEMIEYWKGRKDTSSWYAQRIRDKLMSEDHMVRYRSMYMIKALISIIPLLGLLGTVTGMQRVFQALAALGSTNARAMADGVSAAIIPTMAAMTVSVFSLYFAYLLEKKIRERGEELEDQMPPY